MPIDARLREGLQRSMATIDIDAERLLSDARRRGHRRLMVRRAVAVIAVAAAIAIVAIAGPGLRDLLRNRGRQPAAPPPLVQISGTYTTTITTNDLAGGSETGAVGSWLLTLDRNGSLDLASLTNGNVGRAVSQYQATQDTFLTTGLVGNKCSGLGTYTWSRSGSVLTFSVVSDPCPLRVAIFSSRPWTLQ